MRWLDGVERNLKTLKIKNWNQIEKERGRVVEEEANVSQKVVVPMTEGLLSTTY